MIIQSLNANLKYHLGGGGGYALPGLSVINNENY